MTSTQCNPCDLCAVFLRAPLAPLQKEIPFDSEGRGLGKPSRKQSRNSGLGCDLLVMQHLGTAYGKPSIPLHPCLLQTHFFVPAGQSILKGKFDIADSHSETVYVAVAKLNWQNDS